MTEPQIDPTECPLEHREAHIRALEHIEENGIDWAEPRNPQVTIIMQNLMQDLYQTKDPARRQRLIDTALDEAEGLEVIENADELMVEYSWGWGE